jgi:hypothetical protein
MCVCDRGGDILVQMSVGDCGGVACQCGVGGCIGIYIRMLEINYLCHLIRFHEEIVSLVFIGSVH